MPALREIALQSEGAAKSYLSAAVHHYDAVVSKRIATGGDSRSPEEVEAARNYITLANAIFAPGSIVCSTDQRLCADVTRFVSALGDEGLLISWDAYLSTDAGSAAEAEAMSAFMVYIGRQVLATLGADAPPIPPSLASTVLQGGPPPALPDMPTGAPVAASAPAAPVAPPSAAAPVFELVLFENANHRAGEVIRLSQFRGQPVVVNFWFPSCPPCRAEMPDLDVAFQNHADDGLVVIGVQLVGSDTVADGQEFVDTLGVRYALGADVGGTIVRDYKVLAFPTTVFLDRDHNVVRKWAGVLNAEKIEELIQEARNQGIVEVRKEVVVVVEKEVIKEVPGEVIRVVVKEVLVVGPPTPPTPYPTTAPAGVPTVMPAAPPQPVRAPTAPPAPGAAPAVEIGVQLTDGGGQGPFAFSPAAFSFSAGDTVNFTVAAESVFHTFTVDDLGIDVVIDGGDIIGFSFTFDKPGTYELICIPHQALGMVGTITVSPPQAAPPTTAEGPVSWWPGNGNAIVDGRHGALLGGATFAEGIVGQAFSLDGVDDYLAIPHHADYDFGSGSLTVSALIRTEATTTSGAGRDDILPRETRP
jgi:plastocyanin/peroxiredoxin